MAIAITPGRTLPQKFGMRPTNTSTYNSAWTYMAFGGQTFRSPRRWRKASQLGIDGFIVDTKAHVMDDTSEAGPTIGAGWNMEIAVNDKDNYTTFTWDVDAGSGRLYDYVDDQQTSRDITGKALGGRWQDTYLKIKGHGANLRMARVYSGSISETDQLELRALHLDFEHGDETRFTGGDTDFEITGVHPETAGDHDWTPFDENESCNAYAMVSLVCDNTNRVARETRPAWTIPIYDDNNTAILP